MSRYTRTPMIEPPPVVPKVPLRRVCDIVHMTVRGFQIRRLVLGCTHNLYAPEDIFVPAWARCPHCKEG